MLLEGTNRIALRLSSIEPWSSLAGSKDKPDGEFPGVLAHKRIRPHFHLSLQSGSSRILSSMGRSYTVEEIRDIAAVLRDLKDDPFLACDIIAGFPGETREDFEESYTFCRGLNFAWIHGFPFSPRPGTRAFSFKNRISRDESAKRLERLWALSSRGREEYIRRWTGKTVEAVAEGRKNRQPRWVSEGSADKEVPFFAALTDNDLRVLVKPMDSVPENGSSFRCRISKIPEADKGSFDAAGEVVV
jgi:threonylcarbamoyladenosine tRNA methylthiotransferase MtaB